MAATCKTCNLAIGLTDRIARSGNCRSCDEARKRSEAAARNEYTKWIDFLAARPLDLDRAGERLAVLEPQTGYSTREIDDLKSRALQGFAKTSLWDDVISVDEELVLYDVAGILDLDQANFDRLLSPVQNQIVVGRVNDGRLPVLENPPMILEEGEVAHLLVPAHITKEVAIREYQGGYSGVSFQIAKGVRYHTGGARGRSVVVGTTTELVDAGNLILTSKRSIFLGRAKTFDFRHKKLVSLQMYEDGIQFHVSNRQTAQLLNVHPDNVDVVGAIINESAQRALYPSPDLA